MSSRASRSPRMSADYKRTSTRKTFPSWRSTGTVSEVCAVNVFHLIIFVIFYIICNNLLPEGTKWVDGAKKEAMASMFAV